MDDCKPIGISTRRSGMLALASLALSGKWISSEAEEPVHEPNIRIDAPLVIIPGILGSRLADSMGRIYWGERDSLANLRYLDLEPNRPSPLNKKGIIEKIQLLGPFWQIHEYDELLNHFRSLGYRFGSNFTDPNLFVFDYDWRQSNFDTAVKFQEWIDGNPTLKSRKFDILAHSMGGLVTKLWLSKLGNSRPVRRIIYMAVPFRGSMNSLGTLSNGWGDFENHIAGGISVIRETALSWPSFYELLPSYRDVDTKKGPVRLGTQDSFSTLDVFDPDNWNRNKWLPERYAEGGSRASDFEQNLARARNIAGLMQRRIPGVEEYLLLADNQKTRYFLYVDPNRPDWRNWNFVYSRGDTTVPMWSAANTDIGDFSRTASSFAEHATIFRDDNAKTALKRDLTAIRPPQFDVIVSSLTLQGDRIADLETLDVLFVPLAAAPNQDVVMEITCQFPSDAELSVGDVSAPQIRTEDGQQIIAAEVTSTSEITMKQAKFRARFTAPVEMRVHRFDVIFASLGTRSAYLYVGEKLS